MSSRILGLMGLVAGAAFAPGFATEAHAGISYTCDSSINTAMAGTCAYLNGAVANIYGNTFNNANANIFITMGNTGLGSNTFFVNLVPYATYRSDVLATASNDTVDTSVKTNPNVLPAVEPSLYTANSGNGDVFIRTPLAGALGITGGQVEGGNLIGIMNDGSTACIIGGAGCYDGYVVISNSQPLYYRQNGGSIGAGQYDFYGVVEHETDEVLGTSSCITTASGSPVDYCAATASFFKQNDPNAPSAVDLFRYDAGIRVLSDTQGATDYFSYDAGATNGGGTALYNTQYDGSDWGDWSNTCAFVQDAFGCKGGLFDISMPEINALDAVGFNLVQQAPPAPSGTPEPASIALFGAGLAAAGIYRRRRAA